MTQRTEFSERTIITLAQRVGYRCSNPACRAATAGPHTDSSKATLTGEAAHLTAATPDGPRGDPAYTPAQIHHIDNAIWLCARCHTLIDKDPAAYPLELLRQWKRQAEQHAGHEERASAAPEAAPSGHKTVMISSTILDLPEHRKQVLEACLREDMFPLMMEHLPASADEAIAASLKLVDQADIYLGVFAHRYGYVPEGQAHSITGVENNLPTTNDTNHTNKTGPALSITEMEYNRAVARGMPRLIFLIDKEHPLTIDMVELGEAAEKLARFKKRLQAENIVNTFKSPADLRANAIHSLAQLRSPGATPQFHHISEIPTPPEAYIAHPYTLLQTHRLVGRQAELDALTDWVARPASAIYPARLLCVTAIGGMGKSALTWKWFNEIAPQELKPLRGRLWWSFYESDASFENFVIRALAYVTCRSREDIEKNTRPGEREEQLLHILDQEAYLLVLDGLERILIAYARLDAARLQDDDLDARTANDIAGAAGLPESAGQSFASQHRLRKTADPRAGNFLRRLALCRASRTLVSTRLYPADLQSAVDGAPLAGCAALFLRGLSDADALELWRAFAVSGGRDELLRLFHQFENHPMLVQALASQVHSYRRAPGDFERWQQDHPGFNPFALSLVHARAHVLHYALGGLEAKAQKVLETIAAFRMPASYDTLASLFIVMDGSQTHPSLFNNESELDAVLSELEDRGLLGWERAANRYDLHPIVRGVVWSGLSGEAKNEIYTTLQAYFAAAPQIDDYLQVERYEDLTPAVELYNTLVGLGRYDDAYVVFRDRIIDATLYRLSASRQQAELLEELFPDGVDEPPRLSQPGDQAFTLNALALAYKISGQPGRVAGLFRRHIEIQEKAGNLQNLSFVLCNLSHVLRLGGELHAAEAAARRALSLDRQQEDRFGEAVSLNRLGLALAARGREQEGGQALQRALRLFVAQDVQQSEGITNDYLAQAALWRGDPAAALPLAEKAWELAHVWRYERDFIRAARLHGQAALGLGDFATAAERLQHALACAVNLAEEELPALVALAELQWRQGETEAARGRLEEVWEAAERGPYSLFHADGLLVLAQIERAQAHPAAAIQAATQAYTLAWCDGEPFAYQPGLEQARQLLQELGAAPPQLPPFEEGEHEALEEVEIDPQDEFHASEARRAK